jgi:hypothetical protein
VNERTENIGARRLATVMEHLLDEVSFGATTLQGQTVTVDAAYVDDRLAALSRNEDLSRYILCGGCPCRPGTVTCSAPPPPVSSRSPSIRTAA